MCRLTVRTPGLVWQGDVSSWNALAVLAALSAEPETVGELATALRRYQPDHRLFTNPRPAAERDEAPADAEWCLIDLTGRTVVAGGGFELPEPRSAFQADADDHAEGFHIVWIDVPDDWLFLQADDDWRTVVAERAAARMAVRRLEVRPVLFGLPLLEALAQGVLAADGVVDDDAAYEQTRRIHAAWLLTARDDLGGRTPRQLLLEKQHHLGFDLQHRSEQWSLQKHAALALPRDSAAYRFGGFGITEIVLYFDLVRALLAEAWERIKAEPRPSHAELVEHLAEFRYRWLDEPQPGEMGSALTPAQLIESERRRMPVTSDGSHLDHDCPICQASAELGPMFMCFDGHHLELEDEFAFSLAATREEWEKEQEDYRKFSEEMERKSRERAEAGEDSADPLSGSVWKTSFVDWDGLARPDASPREALMALAFPLAELSVPLRESPAGAELIRSLNAAFGSLRQSQDAVGTKAAAQEIRELLEAASQSFPDLTSRCADLQSRLDEVLRRLG
jgi:hypothetical protein